LSASIRRDDTGEHIQSIDPRDLSERGAKIRCTAVSEVPALVAGARAAQREWEELGLKRRKWAVADLHQAFLENAQKIADLLAEECGRPAGEAWTAEIVANNGLFSYWLGHIDDLLTAFPLSLSPLDYPRKSGVVRLEPKGVLGLITPWNLPVAIPLRMLVPALLAGNAVVWKPSEHTARLSAFLHELIDKHLPKGVVTLLQGGGAVGEALVRDQIDGIFFTGSVRTGKRISAIAGERMIPASLELGGKDAAVVLADAPLERTVNGVVWAAFGFAGQNCAAIERCYVHRSIYDRFVNMAVEATRALRPLQDIGPLVTEAQLDIVRRQVAEAVAGGAKIRCGGGAPGPGWYHEPTVLTDVRDDMAVMREETFGPVLPIVPFDDIDAVIERANASAYGLTASVWTSNLIHGEALAGSFATGVVTINNHAFTGALPDGAWTGVKDSGHGVTNSRFALYEMTRPRTVVVDALSGPHEMWWYPYNDALIDATRGLIELTRKGGDRLQGVRGALSGLLNRWKATK
jgi:acyl-CoA reductase-like NAD-dependent aldehyde dehydrogenase